MVEELYQETNPGAAAELCIGPIFDELLDVSRRYLDALEVTKSETDTRSRERFSVADMNIGGGAGV